MMSATEKQAFKRGLTPLLAHPLLAELSLSGMARKTMGQRIEQNKKSDGQLGIRTGVWLVVFGLVLVCMLTIALSLHHSNGPTGQTASEDVADEDASTQTPARVRRTTPQELTPEVYESVEGYDMGEVQLSMIEQMIQDRRTWMDSPE